MINISNMRKGSRAAKAIFDVEIDGWTIRGCTVVQRPDGKLEARPPLLRDGRGAVQVPAELWPAFVQDGLSEYRRISREEGWGEVCAGEQEALARDAEMNVPKWHDASPRSPCAPRPKDVVHRGNSLIAL